MAARPPPFRVAGLVAVLLVATVAPWLGGAVASNAGPSASFGVRQVREQTGDVATITVEASQSATVNVGSPADNFWLQVRVGSGTTKLRIDTYKAGESDRYSVSEMVWASEGNVKSRTLVTDSIDAPLDPAKYPMNVTIDGIEHDLGTFVVEERTTRDITARIAPRATDLSELSTAAGARKATVPPVDGSVARDDWLLLYVDASGIEGAFEKARLDGDGGVMTVAFRESDPKMNEDPNEFTGASVERVFVPDDAEGFYLVVDTGEHAIEPGDSYRVSFVVPAKSPLADEREEVATTIRVVERRVRIDRRGPGDEVVVEGKTTLTGSTTLTPGTTINVTARDADPPPFLEPRTVTVGSDRTFSVTYDFSGLAPGREFEIRLRDQNRKIPARIAGGTTTTTTESTTTATTTARTPTTQTTATTATTTATTEDPTATTTKATATTTPSATATTTRNGTESTSNATTSEALTQVAIVATERPLTQLPGNASENASDGGGGGPVPGFDPVAGVVALLAGLALAVRRL